MTNETESRVPLPTLDLKCSLSLRLCMYFTCITGSGSSSISLVYGHVFELGLIFGSLDFLRLTSISSLIRPYMGKFEPGLILKVNLYHRVGSKSFVSQGRLNLNLNR